jgi:thiamine pyrophosphokinase
VTSLIVAASTVDPDQLKTWITWADRTIASDGGYDHCRLIGFEPDMVVGDQDSIQADIVAQQTYPREKDFTDLEAALQIAAEVSHEIVVLGATGGRQDHFLNAVMQLFQYDIPIRLIDTQNEIWVEKKPFSFERMDFRYFSLIPLDPVEISLSGAKYNLTKQMIAPYQSLTISNEPRGRVEVDFSDGRIIVVLSRDA